MAAMAMKAMKSATKTMATKAMKAIQWKDHPVYRQWKKEYRAVYYQKNKARIAEYNAVYYQKNKARLAAMQAMKAKKVGRKSLTVLAGTNVVSPKRAKKSAGTPPRISPERAKKRKEYNAVYYQKRKARLAARLKEYIREYRCTVVAGTQAVSPKRFREANPPHDYDDVKTQCHACLRIMEILEQDALYLTRRLWVAWKAFTFNRGESD